MFYNNICENVHQVSCAGIRTHDLLDLSLLSQQLDQGSTHLQLFLLIRQEAENRTFLNKRLQQFVQFLLKDKKPKTQTIFCED